jgi:hypothetical protein
LIKNCYLVIGQAAGKGPPPQKKHFKKFNVLTFFLRLWVIFALLDPDLGTPLNTEPIRIRIRTVYLPITGAEDREGGVEERPARPRGQALEHVMQHHVCQSPSVKAAAKFPKFCYLIEKRRYFFDFFSSK